MEKMYKVLKLFGENKLTYIEIDGFKHLRKHDIFTFDKKHYMIMTKDPVKCVARSGKVLYSGKSNFIDMRELIEKPHTSKQTI